MTNIELYHYGIDEVLDGLIDELANGLNSHTKSTKDRALSNAIGGLKAFKSLIIVSEKETDDV
jgi:hypothetical protein